MRINIFTIFLISVMAPAAMLWGQNTYVPDDNFEQALIDLGWDEQVEFIPYWRKDTGLTVASPAQPVVASGWKRGERNLLVMVLNDSDEKVPCKLTVDLRKYGFRPGAVKCLDYGNGGLGYPESFKDAKPKELAVELDSPLSFEIGRHSYKLLRFFADGP